MIIAADKSEKIASQVAFLLNQHNQLNQEYTAKAIIQSPDYYYPVVINGIVIASVAVKKLNHVISEIRHLVVREEARKCGLGVKLLQLALKKVKTPLVCATIRQDNIPSIKVFVSQKFRRLSKINFEDHSIYYFYREL